MKRTNFYMTAQVFLFVTLFTALNVDAQQWDRFRGPNGSGVSNGEIAPPETWSPTENVKWKAELPGAGVSCPIIIGDKIFLTCYTGYGESRDNIGDQEDLKRQVVCVNREDGSIAWSKTVDAVLPEDKYSLSLIHISEPTRPY